MNYRILQADEWDKLKDIVDSKFIPDVRTAVAAVAEDEYGKIVGVQFLQLAMHCEPLILKSPGVQFDKLHTTLVDALKAKPENRGLTIYAFASNERVGKMAEHNGMTRLPYIVYKQEIV